MIYFRTATQPIGDGVVKDAKVNKLYKCEICEKKGDNDFLKGVRKSDNGEKLEFVEVEFSQKHLCIDCINSIHTLREEAFEID